MDILALDNHALPPEMILDEFHPTADQFIVNAQNTQRAIVAQCALMKPKQVLAVKLAYRGENYVSISKELNVTPSTVGTWVRSIGGRKLRALLVYYQAALDGPNEVLRRAMLWRISVKNENIKPTATIQALQTLNVMANVGEERKEKTKDTRRAPLNVDPSLIRTGLDA